jgi:hypothetical protein
MSPALLAPVTVQQQASIFLNMEALCGALVVSPLQIVAPYQNFIFVFLF